MCHFPGAEDIAVSQTKLFVSKNAHSSRGWSKYMIHKSKVKCTFVP